MKQTVRLCALLLTGLGCASDPSGPDESVYRTDLLSSDLEKREHAALCLAEFGYSSDETADAMRSAANDADPNVRAAAVRALGKARLPGTRQPPESRDESEALLRAFADPVDRVRLAAAGAVKLRDERIRTRLLAAFDDPAWFVRREIVQRLADGLTPEAEAVVARGLLDPDARVREAAALGRQGLDDARAFRKRFEHDAQSASRAAPP